jgi:hypothetical protein
MKKRSYRAQKVNQIEWEEIARSVQDKAMILAIDVAKVEQYDVLMDSERQAVVTVKWDHPAETPELIKRLSALPCGSLTAVMESTGVYGDTLRGQLRQGGFEIHQVSAKRVHDGCEVYDGVPSLHDAKAAQVIARLDWEGASRVWIEASEQPRELNAIGRLYRLYQKQYQQQQNRLEAALTRHWPEVCHYLELDSVTLEEARVARVGWVEAIAETHHNPRRRMMGFALLYPSYSGNGGKRMKECGLSVDC